MEKLQTAPSLVPGRYPIIPGYRILREGHNCFRIADANRAAFLVDAESYFSAFANAVLRARHSIFILGWDIDSRVPLFRDNKERPYPNRLGDFLDWVVSVRPTLHAYVLVWDYNVLYALERELLPHYKFGLRTHRRLHFHMDDRHPMGASHHQKIVVIDDSVAFSGGIDLTRCRWDTPEHRDGDPRRKDPGCAEHSPFHDIQMAVDGEAAQVLGDIARQRWFRATGERIRQTRRTGVDAWPAELSPDMTDLTVAVARTEPVHGGFLEVREVAALFEDSIRAARRYIYLENQYLTSSFISRLLTERLLESDGPEIVIVLPRRSSGRLEEGTMDAIRSGFLEKLREADRYGRLRVYYPKLAGYNHKFLNVHAKVSIIDDDFLRIGSSNLSNRSMGVDTECDMAVEAGGREHLERAIVSFRARLLGEHLGIPGERFATVMDRKESLIAAIEKLRGGERTLEEMDGEKVEAVFDSYIYETSLIDPESPSPPAELINQFIPEEVKRSGRPLVWGIMTLLVLLGLAAAWTWTPLKNWMNLEALLYYTNYIANRNTAPLIVLGVYVIGGIVHFPLVLLIVATAITFQPLTAFVYSLVGATASAVCVYWIGRLIGRDAVTRFGGERLNRLSRKLAKQGLLTILMIRVFPIGPYSFINFIAGASQIGFADFTLGTTLGLLPGLIAITLLGDRLGETLRHPKLENFLLLAGLATVFIVANVIVRKWLSGRKKGGNTALPGGED